MPSLPFPLASEIHAVLGPTNTGKTHRAVQRMLEFETGIIGLPLRLLAREVYDRVVAQVGEQHVALVTGEEKRVPATPRYWVCTVEAMPLDLEADFVAVDEIQLVAHTTRGHVFTQRLLEARGVRETWFLGSDTVRSLLAQLVPTAKLTSYPRLSRLSHVGSHGLSALPRRSAIVAFSLPRVYELAERVRARKGGAAVVLGALSPRTRNAQVAMYQAGEVDYLVATDAIGMGLNLDVEHVAFAGLSKFDGRDHRGLLEREFGQIAGRAGRSTTNGTFGTLRPGPLLPDAVVRTIESHRFESIRVASWRNSKLDFSSIDALLASLSETPRRGCLRRFDGADDFAALSRLATRPWVRDACRGEERVQLLWTVCRVPDYRKLLPEVHADLLAEVFRELAIAGRLRDDWLAARSRPLMDAEGDVDTLLARIASVRTLTYLCQQGGLVENPAEWQQRTRALEDRLSDSLHERLVQRFVERRRRLAPRAAGAPFEQALRARLEATSPELDWTARASEASSDAFTLSRDGRILFEGRELGRLIRGKTLLLPELRVAPLDSTGERKAALSRSLAAYRRDLLAELQGSWYAADGPPAARGLGYQLLLGLGTLERAGAEALLEGLDEAARARLEQGGIRFGRRFIWVPRLLSPKALTLRQALVAVAFPEALPDVSAAAPSLPRPGGMAQRRALLLGYVGCASRWVRCDLVEELLSRCERPDWSRDQLCELLACKKSELEPILEALGMLKSRKRGSRRRIRRIRRDQSAKQQRS